MSNVTVQEALKAAIEAFELHAKQYPHMVKGYCINALEDCKAALSELDNSEPVAKLGRWMIDKSTGTDILTLDNCSVIEGKYANYIMGLLQKEIDKVVSELENTSPQPRDWVSLSDGDIRDVFRKFGWTANKVDFEDARAIEAKLKQLNTKG